MEHDKIKSLLKEIEENKKIEILYACETGSRAWGFASPDSDYDIRFIYKHQLDWYLTLSNKKDTIELMLSNGDLDINGWDLRKSLLLLNKSNAALIERFTSPIVYYEKENFRNDFSGLIKSYYNRTAVFYHHHSLATNFWNDIKDKEDVKLKSLFYLIRSMLSCVYVINKNTVVPMNIHPLLEETESSFKGFILELIALKKEVTEKYSYKLDAFLRDWIVEQFEYINANKNNLSFANKPLEKLDEFFIKNIKQ